MRKIPCSLKYAKYYFKLLKNRIDFSVQIIESGLDIPNANTIIIERSDGYGLADLYCRLLRETIRELKGGRTEEFETTLDLGIEPIIPHSLISDSRNRVTIYRKMAETVDSKGVDELKEELEERQEV